MLKKRKIVSISINTPANLNDNKRLAAYVALLAQVNKRVHADCLDGKRCKKKIKIKLECRFKKGSRTPPSPRLWRTGRGPLSYLKPHSISLHLINDHLSCIFNSYKILPMVKINDRFNSLASQARLIPN